MYVAMLGVVWWTCALFALVTAHVYERCELARALTEEGIGRDHLATWVCIAYHESRFDTAAQNYNSGDHGLLQISQLYWCGPGKACGVSCASLRDEDISNDVKCALRIHEEHTRIQGDGFMAWVVYPLYCKQNTKKYLEGCEESLKNNSLKVTQRPRHHTTVKPTSAPPFLSISNVLRRQYEDEVNSVTDQINWLEYKFDNVDDLSLPEYGGKSKVSESDISSKSGTKQSRAKLFEKSQPEKPENLPAYLTVPSVFQEYYNELQKTNEGEKDPPTWVDVTFDNIDELKLPVPGSKKNSVVTLPTATSKTRLKIGDADNDESKIPPNSPNYLKISTIVGKFFDNEFTSNRPSNNEQKNWSDFAVDDIDKLVVPNNLFNKVSSVTRFVTEKPILEITGTTLNLPAYMEIATLVENQQRQSIKKIQSNWSNVKSQSTPFTITKSGSLEENSKESSNLPSYLNIIRHLYGKEFQLNDVGKAIATTSEIPTKGLQKQQKIETHRHRHRGRQSSHTTTTPEIPTTERPPPPVKPSRRIESNEFRHRSTAKPSLDIQVETNLPRTTTMTSNDISTSTNKPTTNTITPSNNIYQYLPSTSEAPQSVKNMSQGQSVSTETWRKTNSEVYEYKITEKNNTSIPGSWKLSTLVPIIYNTTTLSTPLTKATQSIFEFYLKGQRTSSTSTPKSWLDMGSTPHSVMSTTSSDQIIRQSSTIRPWTASSSITNRKQSLFESTTTTAKPWYSYTSTATTARPWGDLKQKEATTPKPTTTFGPLAITSLSIGSWSSPRSDVTTIKTTARNDPWTVRSYSTSRPWPWFVEQSIGMTTSKAKIPYDTWAKQSSPQVTSLSTLPQTVTITPKTTNDLFVAKNYSTSKPWSWSASVQTDLTTQITGKTTYNPWSVRSSSTSKPGALSSQTETTTQKSSYDQWPKRNLYALKPLSNVSSTPRKLEITTLAPTLSLNVPTSKPWAWSNTSQAVQKQGTVSPTRFWSSPRSELQRSTTQTKESTTQTSSTYKSRFTWDSSNPWSWSWATTPSTLQSKNSSTQSITKSWDPKSFSTYRPWSWMTTTTTPRTFSTSNIFNHSTTKSPLSTTTWSINPQTSNIKYSTTPSSANEFTKPSALASSTTLSLFDLYLTNFGRTPLKGKLTQESAISSATSEISETTARSTDKQHSWQTT